MLSLLLVAALGAVVTPIACQATCPEQEATVTALNYGMPLLFYEQSFKSQGEPANKLKTVTTLADPSSTAVVRPNVDTFYSSMSYDVGYHDIEITVPQVEPNRYWSIAFYTAYGDNYLNIGALNASKSGKYLLTLGENAAADGSIPMQTCYLGYQGRILAPHPIGIFLIRTLLKNSNEDVDVAAGIATSFTTKSLERTAPVSGPGLDMALFATQTNVTTERILTLTALFTNTTFGKSTLSSSLALAGISNGIYAKPKCVNLTQAGQVSSQMVLTWPTVESSTLELPHNWSTIVPSKVGIYGDDYVARAAVGRTGYLALVVEEAIYPEYSGNFSLAEDEAYLVHFSGKPPLDSLGFWSLTMYNDKGYLVENSEARYSLGDRSNFTYSNGDLVYGSNMSASDGPFDILIQRSDPGTNWTSNWLPSPQSEPKFGVLLRFYAPEVELQEGTYEYPLITKQSSYGSK